MSLITVGIPVFNAMPYLPESLDSILRQNYSDFEILVINDGSTDDSLEYLLSVRDRRLRIVNQENRGLTATLNRMLAEVSTPWLARHDADDVAYPDRLARAADYISRYPEAGMFYSFAEYYPATTVGRYHTTIGNPNELRNVVQSGYLLEICHPTVVLNVVRAKAVGGYRFNLHVEDADLWWRIVLRYEIRLIREVLTGFRQNLQSLSSINLEQQALNTLYIQYLLISHLWNREPLAYEEVRGPLKRLFNPKKIKFRSHLRAFNIQLGLGNMNRAFGEAASAFATSPTNFVHRLWDEFFPCRPFARGEPPEVFKKYGNALWPNDAGTRCTPFELLPKLPW